MEWRRGEATAAARATPLPLPPPPKKKKRKKAWLLYLALSASKCAPCTTPATSNCMHPGHKPGSQGVPGKQARVTHWQAVAAIARAPPASWAADKNCTPGVNSCGDTVP